ncbi:LLM class flavin-dependent oxidoreductase [Streptomyces ossamyceticus]|uniref:LLM class flavin-dependent oxidoreductase n=1 Tax=Streptomyces ossamyceticus TaxID=249581 RepID=UPI0039C98B3A
MPQSPTVPERPAVSESPAVPARGRVGVMLPLDLPVGEVLPYVRRAEELGFDQVWVVEDLGWRGGVAQAATVLASTTLLTLGIGIMPAGARNVCFAAMELAALAQLHPGRLIAGIGHGMPGWMRQVGSWPESPLTLIKEYARALRLLIAGEPGPENGRYARCEGVVITEIPDIVPPVILGVRGPRSQAVAGEVADGLLLAEPAAPNYITASLRLPALRRRPTGRTRRRPLRRRPRGERPRRRGRRHARARLQRPGRSGSRRRRVAVNTSPCSLPIPIPTSVPIPTPQPTPMSMPTSRAAVRLVSVDGSGPRLAPDVSCRPA